MNLYLSNRGIFTCKIFYKALISSLYNNLQDSYVLNLIFTIKKFPVNEHLHPCDQNTWQVLAI